MEGCDGDTECGARPKENSNDTWSIRKKGRMATFTFTMNWTKKWTLDITKSIKNTIFGQYGKGGPFAQTNPRDTAGCGKTISWKEMAPVSIPFEIIQIPASTKDVPVISQGKPAKNWKHIFEQRMQKLPPIKVKLQNKN